MVDDEKSKVSRKVILPFVARMSEHVDALETIINEMPESGAKKSFGITLDALKKKFNRYSSGAVVVVQGEVLNEKEKAFLEKFRAEQISLEQGKENQVSESSSAGMSDDKTATKKTVKKKK